MSRYVKIALTLLFMATGVLYLVWMFYLIVMTLKRARDAKTLSPYAHIMAVPLIVVAEILDAIGNWTFCTILFLELPREILITSRLKRLILSEGWRSDFAGFICGDLLNAFDPSGNHCR